MTWQELGESWLSTDVPPQSGTGPGAPSQFLSTAVWPILMSEVRKANPSLSQRAAAGRIADWVEQWASQHEAQAGRLGLLHTDRQALIDRIRKSCR